MHNKMCLIFKNLIKLSYLKGRLKHIHTTQAFEDYMPQFTDVKSQREGEKKPGLTRDLS